MSTTRTLSATQARVHFGELLTAVIRGGETIIVEKSGVPAAVVVSIEEYEQLVRSRNQEARKAGLTQAREFAGRLSASRSKPLPPAEKILQDLREEP